MKSLARITALIAFLAGAGVATPFPAMAAVQHTGSFTFATTLTDVRDNVPGAYEGILNLHISQDGIIQGTYRSLDEGTDRPVTGGLTGTKVWLEIGDFDSMHIDGTFAGGKITGYTQLPGYLQYEFDATPVQRQQ
jgi:hypothetical protein